MPAESERTETERVTDLFVNLFEKLEFFLESLASVLGVDMQQRLVVQVLHRTSHAYRHMIHIISTRIPSG